MDGSVPRVVYSKKVRQQLREAEERLLVTARTDGGVREALRAALAAGDVFLSQEGASEVASWPSSAPARRISSAVAGDLAQLRLAALVARVAQHGLALLAKASRWDGTVEGAEVIAPGLLEPDVLGDDEQRSALLLGALGDAHIYVRVKGVGELDQRHESDVHLAGLDLLEVPSPNAYLLGEALLGQTPSLTQRPELGADVCLEAQETAGPSHEARVGPGELC